MGSRFRHALAVALALLGALLLPPGTAGGQTWQFPLGDETTPDRFDLVFTLKAPTTWPAEARVQVALCMQDEGNYYYAEVAASEVVVGRCEGGQRRVLAKAGGLFAGGNHEVAIQRRACLLQVVCDGRRVLTAYDDRYRAGKVATAAPEGFQLEEVTAQPIGEIYLDDDFTRTPEQSGDWKVLGGEWRSSGESTARPQPQLSANPFSYHVKAAGKALAATGYDFWADHSFRAAVKPAAPGAVGLAFYLTDADNYYLLRWSRTEAAGAAPTGRLQLIRVQDGSWTVLAEQVGLPYRIDQWYDVKVAVADGNLEAYLDGNRRLTTRDRTYARGRVALFVQDCESAFFDDVQVRAHDSFAEDFSSPDVTAGRCWPVLGNWKVDSKHLYGAASEGVGRALMVTGEPTWGELAFEAMVKLKDAARVGLVFSYQDPENYHLVRWGRGAGKAVRELVRVAEGQEQVIATAPCTPTPTEFERMRLVCHRGHVQLTADEKTALEATDADLAAGRIGFYVEGANQACFDNVAVSLLPAPFPPPAITKQFTREDSMAGWAGPQASWVSLPKGVFRSGLPIFADFRVYARLKKLSEQKGQLDFFIGTDEQLNGGARVAVVCEGGVLHAELTVADQVLAKGEARSDASAPVVVVERHGAAVIVLLMDEATEVLALAHQVGSNVMGKWAGFRRSGYSPGADDIHLTSDGILDHTFSGAPTAWRPGAGIWEVYDRWPCSRGWSWFGGRDEAGTPKNPILWSKDTWAGETVLQFWAALIMDMDHEPGYSDPSDINCTICADGENLCSGYSFIFAGDHNKGAKILRGNEVVAETNRGRFINPVSRNFAYHRHWFETRVHKVGGHLAYYMDNALMLEYDDPNPLLGGDIAVWSYNNGILVSRIKISAERRLMPR